MKQKNYSKLLILITLLLFLFAANYLPAGNKETYKGLKLFSDVIEIIEKNYIDVVDTEKLIHSAIQGMVRSLDPHSSFMPPEAFEELQIDTHGEFGGIGIVITVKDGILTVISPIEGTPASRKGIKAGDKIIKVNDESTKDMEMWEAVRKMRGPKGTSVKITIAREGEKEPFDVEIIRDIIPIESVKSSNIEEGYAYVWITNFRDKTTDDLLEALEKMENTDHALKGLILDLRDNPGGLLDQAVKVTDLFIQDGNIVTIKGRKDNNTKIFKAHENEIKRDYPIVVLINGGSASASEIVAGALQDHKRALIIGTTSFGKGSVQTVEPLRDGYGLKYTIARYFTPKDRSIQAQGIKPDIVVKSTLVEVDKEDLDGKKYLKEKDLKNHLKALPMKGDKKNTETNEQKNKQSDEKNIEQKDDNNTSDRDELRHGKITKDDLLSDYQIKRALDILKGYEILSGLRN